VVTARALQHIMSSRQLRLPSTGTVEIPHVALDDVIGLEEVKAKLQEVVVWPHKYRQHFAAMHIRSSSGILLYGVPGTGKTMLAKAVATELSANFITVHIADLIHGEVGESEQTLAELFRIARSNTPCIVFMDELQAMFTTRGTDNPHESKLVSQLFLEMDIAATVEGVVVLGATNLPDMLDPSLLSAGRMDVHLHVPPPSAHDREVLLRWLLEAKLQQQGNAELLAEVPKVAASTHLFTGADLATLCNAAALNAFHRQQQQGPVTVLQVHVADLQHALQTIRPSVTQAMVDDLWKWRATA
jgi:SpoVK/Ycf46/Vps4 family AAA+-type ATPase